MFLKRTYSLFMAPRPQNALTTEQIDWVLKRMHLHSAQILEEASNQGQFTPFQFHLAYTEAVRVKMCMDLLEMSFFEQRNTQPIR